MNILEALTVHYGQLVARGEAPPYGYARKRIGYALVLSPEGEPVAVTALSDSSAPSPSGYVCEVPHPVRRTSSPRANFLWDKTAYVFGVKRHPMTRRPCAAPGEHRAFVTLHEALLSHTDDEGLRALLGFLHTWEPPVYQSLPHAEDMLDGKVVFRLEGADGWLHARPASRAIWAEHLAGDRGPNGLCLVSGAQAPIERVHPSVRGVAGAHSAGAVLVPAATERFASYGHLAGETGVSIEAAFAYATALNALLAPGSRRFVHISDMTVVFWAAPLGDAPTAWEAEALVSQAIAEGEGAVGSVFEAIARGEPLPALAVPLGTRLHILGLVANVGRLSVRLWHVDTIGAFTRRFAEHFDDLRLEPPAWSTPPSVRRLLFETTPKRASARIPPFLGAALLRSILTGTRYPRRLLTSVIARVRADKNVSAEKAALCRACLARDHRLGFAQESPPMSLNRDEPHPAYRLGRLFAVYERVQRSALGPVNATIRDRYFGAASATPASVFPLLARKCVHHLATLRRNDRRRGLGHWYEREIEAIAEGLDTGFPRILRLDDQGRFALGYYHQRRWKRDSEQAPGADRARDSEAEG